LNVACQIAHMRRAALAALIMVLVTLSIMACADILQVRMQVSAANIGFGSPCSYRGNLALAACTSQSLAGIEQGVNQSSDFGVEVFPQTQSVNLGQSAVYEINETSYDGFASTIYLSLEGLPPNTTCIFDPPSVTLIAGSSTQSVLTVFTDPTGSGGNYTLMITATAEGLRHVTTLHLNVVGLKSSNLAITEIDIVKIIIVTSLTLTSMLVAVVGILLNIYSTLKLRPSANYIIESFRKLIWRVYYVLFLGGLTSLLSLVHLFLSPIQHPLINDITEILFCLTVVLFGSLIIAMLVLVRNVMLKIFKEVI